MPLELVPDIDPQTAAVPEPETKPQAEQKKLVLNKEESLEVWYDHVAGFSPLQISKRKGLRLSTVEKAIDTIWKEVALISADTEHTKLVEYARLMTSSLSDKVQRSQKRIDLLDIQLGEFEDQGLNNLEKDELGRYLKILQARQSEVAIQIKFSTEIRNYIDTLAHLTGAHKYRPTADEDQEQDPTKGINQLSPTELRALADKYKPKVEE